ncbi:hypothetical protein AB205_0009410, partial [Aquarana catesbeiana]
YFLAKPQLLVPVSRRLVGPGELKYLVTLEKFYPKEITIRWTNGVGEPQESLSSTESFTDIPDGTHSVCSEVTIPEELLKNTEFTVRVSWEHETLDTPGYKDLSIRDSDYLWTPVVKEIQKPKVFHDTPVTLQCHISGYFPNDITVNWLRRSLHQELCEETNLVIRTRIPRKEADNTYSCTATLTIIPTLSIHQGAEYICRVDHPSLERPIERITEKIAVQDLPWIPQVEEIIVPKLEEKKKASLTCNISGYFPDHLKVSWFKKEPGTDSHPIKTPLPNDYYKVIEAKDQKEKLSCQSCLKFTYTSKRDHGAEFICRVDHPILEHPIERSTGPIGLGKLSMNRTRNT